MDSFLLSYFIHFQIKAIAYTKGQFDTPQKSVGTPFFDLDAANEGVKGLPI